MENENLKFWSYLIDKKKKISTKKEISEYYRIFKEIWGEKDKDFERVFDSLRKNKIKYMFNKEWYILNEEEFEGLKNKKYKEYEFLLKYLDKKGIKYYIGLSNAKYLNMLTWQSLNILHIINNTYNIERKMGDFNVKLIKFPEVLFIDMALKKTKRDIYYSDAEKTFLDEIYYKEYKNKSLYIKDYDFDELDKEKIIAYLSFYRKYPKVGKRLRILFSNKKILDKKIKTLL